jgi:hypothetical protein
MTKEEYEKCTDNQKQIIDALKGFRGNVKSFVSREDAAKDVQRHFERVTKRYKKLSEKYKEVSFENPYRHHYPLRHSHVIGKFNKIGRRDFAVDIITTHYMKTPKGTIYRVANKSNNVTLLYSAHVLDRFVERELRKNHKEDTDFNRNEVTFDVITRFAYQEEKPVFKDESIYQPIEGGYLIGTWLSLHHGNDPHWVEYYKTYLSDDDLSEEKKEWIHRSPDENIHQNNHPG